MTGTSLREQGDVPMDLPDDGDQNEEIEDAWRMVVFFSRYRACGIGIGIVLA